MTVPGLGAPEATDGPVPLPDSSGDVRMVDGEPEELEEGEEEEAAEEEEEEAGEEDEEDEDSVSGQLVAQNSQNADGSTLGH